MESTLQDLKTRRSIKRYKPDRVDAQTLAKILEAATYAPTGRGLQSAKIVVIQNKEIRDKISKLNASFFPATYEGDPFYGAPMVIVVFGDSTMPTYIYDGSLVMGNLMNAAHALGVDTCWIHRAKETFSTPEGKALMKQWGVGEEYVGIGNCIIGYADGEIPKALPRKDDYIVYVK